MKKYSTRANAFAFGTVLISLSLGGSGFAADPVRIGHVAALSGASAQSGEAITRGLSLAIDQINAKGGLLGGRKVELVQRDDESTPPKGLTAARELIFKEGVVALFGGIDTPVSLAIVPLMNKEKRIFMGVWAAGTGITRNGANPNYVFRVSAVDDLVDVKLLKYAHEKLGAKKAGLCSSTIRGANQTRRVWWRPAKPTLASQLPASKSSRTTTSTWFHSSRASRTPEPT